MTRVPIRTRSREDLMKDYPIESSVAGWFFRYTETSNNVYLVEGCDLWGRKVSRSGTDPAATVSECEADAREINKQVSGAF